MAALRRKTHRPSQPPHSDGRTWSSDLRGGLRVPRSGKPRGRDDRALRPPLHEPPGDEGHRRFASRAWSSPDATTRGWLTQVPRVRFASGNEVARAGGTRTTPRQGSRSHASGVANSSGRKEFQRLCGSRKVGMPDSAEIPAPVRTTVPSAQASLDRGRAKSPVTPV
jgi:hypothetical protein